MRLAIEVVARLDQLSFRGGQCGGRRAQCVLLVHRIERRQNLVRLDTVADVGQSLQDTPADAKGERDFVLCENLSGQDDRFADVALGGGYRAHRATAAPRLRVFSSLQAPSKAERGKKQKSPRKTAASGRSGLARGHRGPWKQSVMTGSRPARRRLKAKYAPARPRRPYSRGQAPSFKPPSRSAPRDCEPCKRGRRRRVPHASCGVERRVVQAFRRQKNSRAET